MKRELTKQEKEQTKKAIERVEKQIKDYEENLMYNTFQREYQEASWKWEDYSRPLKRKKIKEEYKNAEDTLKQSIEETKISLREMKKQLNEGVEVKKATGVQ